MRRQWCPAENANWPTTEARFTWLPENGDFDVQNGENMDEKMDY
jgi:hypothetical protein